MSRHCNSSLHHRAGFSLVEIMVGLVIGMLAMIIMMQVYALSEERKRTADSGGDAQSNGVNAFYQVQRDIGQAGFGFAAIDLFNCNMTWDGAATAIPLAPVTIKPKTSAGDPALPPGDEDTDTLLVIYGNANGEPQGTVVNTATATSYTVKGSQNVVSYTPGDRVIGAPTVKAGDPCNTTLKLGTILTPASGASASDMSVAAGEPSAKVIYNFGPTSTVVAVGYAIRKGNLTRCDLMVNDCTSDANKGNDAIWVPISNGIVSMRAMYGRDTQPPSMDGIPDQFDQSTPTGNCGWARISAVSLVLVARSSQYDKGVDEHGNVHLPTSTALNSPDPANAPRWMGTDVNNISAPFVPASVPIKLGPDVAADEAWKHYRYSVFESIVPIRNIAWMGVTTGC